MKTILIGPVYPYRAGIESNAPANQPYQGRPCQEVAVYVDGVWRPGAADVFQTMALQ